MKKMKNTPKKININYSKSTYDQLSFTKYDSQINNYGSYLGQPTFEDYKNTMGNYDDCDKSFKIISHTLLVGTPMDDNSLRKLVSSIKKVLDVVKLDLPESFGFIKTMNINIHYNNYGSTFLEWELLFKNNKFKKFKKTYKINEIFDFIVKLDLYDFSDYNETIYNINILYGDVLFEIIESGDREEIEYQFKNLLELKLEYGYELNDVEDYVKEYGIDRDVVESALKNLGK